MYDLAGISALLDKHASAGVLARVGLPASRVRELTAQPTRAEDFSIAPDEARRASARAWKKQSSGSAQIPLYVVRAMAADYERLGSLRQVGKIYDRDPSSIRFLLRSRGVTLRRRGGRNHSTSRKEVSEMAAAYRDLRSLRKVGELFGRDMSTMRTIFRNHGVPVNPRGGPNHLKAAA